MVYNIQEKKKERNSSFLDAAILKSVNTAPVLIHLVQHLIKL